MTETLTVLGPTAVRRWFEQGLRSMLAVRKQVDVLNVFPVPDGDTGTNLVLTLAAAAKAAGELDRDTSLRELTAAAARGALIGARGNSGVILSQAMRGLARSAAGRDALDGPALAAALDTAADDARKAVERPVEGTVLTVAAAAAQAARDTPDQSLSGVATAAVEAATVALAHTRSQLPVLAEREVVDAGAAGYVILLEALAAVVDGGRPATSRAGDALASLWSEPRPAPAGPACALGTSVVGEHDGAHAAFEVMYVLHATSPAAAALRARLDQVGESVAVVGGSDGPGHRGLWQVHVHTDDPAAVLGEPADMEQVCVRSLIAPSLGTLACTRIPGLAAPLAATGAGVVLHPDAAGLERGAVDTGTDHVLVLPCDADCAALADQLFPPDGETGLLPGSQRVAVADTRTDMEVLAVVAEQHPGAPAEFRVQAAREAAGRVRPAACAVADLEDVVRDLLDPQDELLTAVVGAAARPGTPVREDVLARLRSAVGASAPQAELVLLDGGQPTPDLILGAQ